MNANMAAQATTFGWFRCTPESRALLAQERAKVAADELAAETERLGLYENLT